MCRKVGLCKIADAFYASEGKSESRRDTMETLVVGDGKDGNSSTQTPASGGGVAPSDGTSGKAGFEDEEGAGEEEEVDQGGQFAPDRPAAPAPESCGGTAADGKTDGVRPANAAPSGNSEAEDAAGERGSSPAAGAGAAAATAAAPATAGEAGDSSSDGEEKEEPSLENAPGRDTKSGGDPNAPVTAGDNAAGAESRGPGGGAPGTSAAGSALSGCGGGSDEEERNGREEQKEGQDEDENSGDDSEEERGGEEKGGDRAAGGVDDSDGDEKQENGGAAEKKRREASEEDEERIRRVRVAQSLAMYRAQLAAERRLAQVSAAEANDSLPPQREATNPRNT